MKQKALKTAFPYTLPIFAVFRFLALAYGILMNMNGLPFPVYTPCSNPQVSGMADLRVLF